MPLFGSFALLLGLALSAYSLVVGTIALCQMSLGKVRSSVPDRLAETARRAGIGSFVCVTSAALALVYLAFTNDFSVAYILHHSNRDLPSAYKFAALWSGQEGSLLFWAWLLSIYGLVLRLRHKVDVRLVAHASTILSGIQVFFLLLLNCVARPFSLTAGGIPLDGNGLNPLLQYPEMVIHPPMLYLGYVGFSVPFAFALGALIMKYPGEKWIHITRRWTMVTWLFLTCGIFLGMHWAYSVLGWGGYWGWDPVENASFLPWLTGTAFLHSVMMQEKRGMMKSWNVWLIFTTFMLSILGTFLTRSGVVSSVHAFAQSSIGDWFLVFLAITILVCAFFYIRNRSHLVTEHKLESLVSRESSFMFNNLVFLAACFAVLWGTLFPILSEWIQGNKVTVGPPFFNRVCIPIGLFLLFLTGVGPLLAWRSTSFQSIKRNFAIPTGIAAALAVLLLIFGVSPWNSDSTFPALSSISIWKWPGQIISRFDEAAFFSLTAFTLSAFVITAISSEFLRGAMVISRHTGKNLFSAVIHLTRRNTRRYGGYIVHFGVVLVFIGLAGAAFNKEQEKELGFNDEMNIGHYRLVCKHYTQDDNPNYSSESAILDVYKGDKQIGQLYPENRTYKASEQPSHMVAIRSTLAEDLYVIYAGKNPDTDRPIIKAFVNPLVIWIWIGVIIVAFGTGIALIPSTVPVTASAREPAVAVAPSRLAPGPAGGGD